MAMTLSPRFEQALVYSAILHAGQARKKSSIPYLSHVLSVAALALENGANEDEAIAALLHDAVEDAGGMPRLEDIGCRFGSEVAEIVLGCTDTDQTPKPPWKERKERYIAHLAHGSDSVKLVSCADKLHKRRSIGTDLRELGDAVWSRFTGGKEGKLWDYQALIETDQKNGA